MAEFHDIAATVGTLGLRTAASPRHNILIQYVLAQLNFLRGFKVTTEDFPLLKWQTRNDATLHGAGRLALQSSGGKTQDVPIVGAIPWTAPTNGTPVTAEMVYVPLGVSIATANVSGKIVLRDFGPTIKTPYAALFALSFFLSNDMEPLRNSTGDRPYTYTPDKDLIDAGVAGAAGLISMINVPRKDVESYFDPHSGTQFRLPGIYVGAAEAKVLKDAASRGLRASMSVEADRGPAMQTQIRGRLQGTSNDTIYVICHTDGTTWVQDSGISAMLTLARYFSSRPKSSRGKTLEFVFTTGHLGYNGDTTYALAAQLDKTYDTDNTVLAIALEHMGTKEILPRGSDTGAANGRELAFTGKGEVCLWSVGPSTPLRKLSAASAQRHKLDRMVLAAGIGAPNPSAVPDIVSFGGIGTGLHWHLIPTMAIVSGPWSLWAPGFGASAIDFSRLRKQTMAFADVIIGVGPLSKKEIAGDYTSYRSRRANGTTWATEVPPPVYPPGPTARST
ncbi:hypothetical protein CAC42_882 [Sphaceloma murrayae]|uniref:Peptide hydrolase n=1 Tax=Sphaceloma murrayae TaxID=2082308 RepID=A0A2K1QLD1_9PEZI|nr:hypothetical protein CAC42_882 [Sphaceloma murrayae]